MANASIGKGGNNNDVNVTRSVKNYGTSDKASLKDYKKQSEQQVKIDFDLKKKYMKLYQKEEFESQKQYQERIAKYAQDYEKRKNNMSFNQAKKHMEDLAEYGTSFTQRMIGSLAVASLNSVKKGWENLNKGIEEYMGAYSQYYSGIETRLLGSEKSFKSTSSTISKALTGNTAVTQLAVLKKLSDYVEKGISYNVEQRAFLGTVADKIATTFDAANGTLLQLVKIQQADSTAARLGMESTLNKFLNSTFKDTSYLNTLSKEVSSSLLGANSQLSRDGSLAFEYVVQKWLGSMSSVGVNSSTIQSIAEGLNYLGTGNVSALTSNQALNNLFALSASNAGLNYSSLLNGGLNANTANQLLHSIVNYTQTIAKTNSQVTKSAYANLFGMTVADLTSILNLSTEDLASISKNMLTYSQAINETERSLATVGDRVTVQDKINNLFNNVFSSVGEQIANSPFLYTTYKVTDMVESFTGGIGIPAITSMVMGSGFGFDINMSVEQIIKAGIIGLGALAKTGQIVGGLVNNRKLTLDKWGAEATTGRGRGLATTLSDTNVGRTVSQTAYIGNSDESALYAGTVTAEQDKVKEQIQGDQAASEKEESSEVNKAIITTKDTNLAIYTLLEETFKDAIMDIKADVANIHNYLNFFNR